MRRLLPHLQPNGLPHAPQPHPSAHPLRLCSSALACTIALMGCGGDDTAVAEPTSGPTLQCNESLKARFQPDANTSVLLVKAFQKGDPLLLSGQATAQTPLALNDLCLVKLNVGPGNPGPSDAPSTSKGIGIEVWLPGKEAWNGRVHAVGGGGWVGNEQGDVRQIAAYATSGDGRSPAQIAGADASVSSSTDTGHQGQPGNLQASFAMLPDGRINTTLWNDFASRGIHEQAVKTKALAQAYYGKAAQYSYWDGGSTGGRQALKLAQQHPEDFNGILAGYPAINWSKFITAELYPQVVINEDLGGVYMSAQQLDAVSNAAIASCGTVGGKALGYIPDPASCRYDPTQDAKVLCSSAGGSNSSSSCVTPVQARAINKIWYGMTRDGTVPDPAIDNGWGGLDGVHLWYGLARGASLQFLAGPTVFPIASEMVALELQDPTLASPLFSNATGKGQDGWKSLTYAQLTQAFEQGLKLQAQFGQINTDNPDLSAFKARGGKIIHYTGLHDPLIPPQGSSHYYQQVLAKMGGLPSVQSFYRLFEIAGMGHGSYNQTANPQANPPMPAPSAGFMHQLLMQWVENGQAPDKAVLSSVHPSPDAHSRPLCAYPHKATYVSGDPYLASSFICK